MKQILVLASIALFIAGCQQRTEKKPSSIYGVDYTPVRTYESSVLNQPDIHGQRSEHRLNGTGYGPVRPETGSR